jgi:hypothetical protein
LGRSRSRRLGSALLLQDFHRAGPRRARLVELGRRAHPQFQPRHQGRHLGHGFGHGVTLGGRSGPFVATAHIRQGVGLLDEVALDRRGGRRRRQALGIGQGLAHPVAQFVAGDGLGHHAFDPQPLGLVEDVLEGGGRHRQHRHGGQGRLGGAQAFEHLHSVFGLGGEIDEHDVEALGQQFAQVGHQVERHHLADVELAEGLAGKKAELVVQPEHQHPDLFPIGALHRRRHRGMTHLRINPHFLPPPTQ